jgi:hypothetical protein
LSGLHGQPFVVVVVVGACVVGCWTTGGGACVSSSVSCGGGGAASVVRVVVPRTEGEAASGLGSLVGVIDQVTGGVDVLDRTWVTAGDPPLGCSSTGALT